MTPALLLGASVLAHVTWNLLARRQQPSGDFLWWAVACYCLAAAPCLLHPELHDPTVLRCLVVTGLFNGWYFICLARAYEAAPVSVVYPLARSSPLLLAVVEVGVLGVGIGPRGIVAIVICVLGILLLSCTRLGAIGRRGSLWALLAATATVGYSLSDKAATTAGLRSLPACLGYVAGTFAIALGILAVVRWRQRLPWCPPRPAWPALLAGAACVGPAYALVVAALHYLPASVTVAWTNAGIVIGVLLAIVLLRERQHLRLRLLSVGITVTGLVLLAC